MPFPNAVREEALLRSGRTCCVCHRFVGLKIEVHHIDPEAKSRDNTIENAIPLCFDCHADMINYDPAHPKGTKYTPSELKRHRDSWYEKIASSPQATASGQIFASDRKAYDWITERLSWNLMQFLKEHDFGNVFQISKLHPLQEIMGERDNPFREFMDPTLEALRADLISGISKFMWSVATNTVPTKSHEFQKIPREWHGDSELEEDEFYRRQTEINDLADGVLAGVGINH